MSMLKEKLNIENKTTPREIEVGTTSIVKTKNNSWEKIAKDSSRKSVNVEESNFAEWKKAQNSKS